MGILSINIDMYQYKKKNIDKYWHRRDKVLGYLFGLGWNIVVRIDKKFNEEQLLLDTFLPKMHIERDICKKLIFKFSIGV